MTALRVAPLDETTASDFARLFETHNGVWAAVGAWPFTSRALAAPKTALQNRLEKERRVRVGRAHAILVYDGPACVGWCQFGAAAELPRIKRRRAYSEGLSGPSGLANHVLLRPQQVQAQRSCVFRARRRSTGNRPSRGRTVESYPEGAKIVPSPRPSFITVQS